MIKTNFCPKTSSEIPRKTNSFEISFFTNASNSSGNIFAPPELMTLSILHKILNSFSVFSSTKSLVLIIEELIFGAEIFRQPRSSNEILTP